MFCGKDYQKLSEKEQHELITKINKEGDTEAKHKLCKSYIPLIKCIRRMFTDDSNELDDLLSIGLLKLVEEVEKLEHKVYSDFYRHIKLAVYGAMLDYLQRQTLVRQKRKNGRNERIRVTFITEAIEDWRDEQLSLEIRDVIDSVISNENKLAQCVFEKLSEGYTQKEIADEAFCSQQTVSLIKAKLFTAIKEKLNV